MGAWAWRPIARLAHTLATNSRTRTPYTGHTLNKFRHRRRDEKLDTMNNSRRELLDKDSLARFSLSNSLRSLSNLFLICFRCCCRCLFVVVVAAVAVVVVALIWFLY